VLFELEPDDLNTLLTKTANGILKCLEEAAKNGNAEHLACVLRQLNPDDLNILLTTHDGILKCLEEAAKNGNAKHLACVIERLNPADLNAILQTKILDSEHLAAPSTCFKPEARNTLFKTTENGVLEHLEKNFNI
jgi:hypothetical protein